MGISASTPQEEPLPALYGGRVDLNTNVKGAYQHRGLEPEENSVIIASKTCIEVYNEETADRRVKVNAGNNAVTCADYIRNLSLGFPAVVVGTMGGDLIVYHAETLVEYRRVRACRGPCFITCVSCPNPNLILVGNSDGTVLSYRADKHLASNEFVPPQEALPHSEAAENRVQHRHDTEVVSMTLFGPKTRLVLAVGLRKGTILTYGLHDGNYLAKFSLNPNLHSIISLAQYRCLLCIRQDDSSLYVRDWVTNKTVVLDPSEELDSLGKAHTKTCSIVYDDMRGILFCGCSDGSIMIRRLLRDRKSKEITMRLVKVCNPKSKVGYPIGVVRLWYNSKTDTLVAGDNSGQARCIRNVTGVSNEEMFLDNENYAEELQLDLENEDDIMEEKSGASNVVHAKGKKWVMKTSDGVAVVNSIGAVTQYYFDVHTNPSLTPNCRDILGSMVSGSFLCPFYSDQLNNESIERGEMQPFPFGYAQSSGQVSKEWKPYDFADGTEAKSHEHRLIRSKWALVDSTGFVKEVQDGQVLEDESSSSLTNQASLTIRCDSPGGLTGVSLKRSLSIEPYTANVQVSIHSNKDIVLPIGIVFPFFVCTDSGSIQLTVPGFEMGYTSPMEVTSAKGDSVKLGSFFESLENVPVNATEETVNLEKNPFLIEGMVQLCGVDEGCITVHHGEHNCGYKVSWDHNVLNSVLIKTERVPRSSARKLLVCPVRAAFDYSPSISSNGNPLDDRGISTACKIHALDTLTFSYKFEMVTEENHSASSAGISSKKKKGKKDSKKVGTSAHRRLPTTYEASQSTGVHKKSESRYDTANNV